MSIYYSLSKIILITKISIPWKILKATWNSSLLKIIKKKKLWEDRIMK